MGSDMKNFILGITAIVLIVFGATPVRADSDITYYETVCIDKIQYIVDPIKHTKSSNKGFMANRTIYVKGITPHINPSNNAPHTCKSKSYIKKGKR